MPMNGQEKLVVGATATISAASFFLSSLATQDSALGGQSVFDPESQKKINAIGWVATGAVGVVAGAWAKSRALTVLGATIAIGGLAWVFLVPHPVFNRNAPQLQDRLVRPDSQQSSGSNPGAIPAQAYVSGHSPYNPGDSGFYPPQAGY